MPRVTAAAFGTTAKLWRACLARPGAVVAVVALVGATGAISMNALTNQAGRHPAPLFGEAPVRPRPAVREVGTPVAPSAPPRVATTPAAPPAPPRRDPIGELIRSDAVTTASTGAKADPDVRLAQRALAKLGYGTLKADGLIGAETRTAIERFERDRKLPTTGQAAGRTLRALAQASGLAAAPTPAGPATGDTLSDPKTID